MYLRGLLRPGKPFGRRSRLREMMLLDTLEAEQDAAFADRETLLHAIVSSGANMDGNSRKKVLKELVLALERADLLRSTDYDGIVEHGFANSSLAAETVHGILKETGLLGDRSHENEHYEE